MDSKSQDKKAKDSFVMAVSLEFKDLCDQYAKKIEEYTWGAVEYSYKELTKIMARKIKEAKIL